MRNAGGDSKHSIYVASLMHSIQADTYLDVVDLETDAKNGTRPRNRAKRNIHNFEPFIVKLCQNN